MIIEGGRIKYAWGLQLLAIVFGWLTGPIRVILLPKGELRSVRFTILFAMVLVVCVPVLSQDCDVDFPGTSTLNFSATCGGSPIDNLTLGKNISLGDNDTFTFDAPAAINILGSLDVDAQGDGRIIIPAGVTVIIDGNMRLDPNTGGCESGNPCTFTIEVNGYLQILGDFRSNLVTLVWEGSGTVEVKDKFENSSNACMTCSVNCPSFPIGAGGCDDKGSGCTEDFCVSHYGSTNCGSDNIDPTITNCPVDMVVSTLPGSCDAVVNWTPPTASDNCNLASFTGSHNPGEIFGLGITTVTYSAVDDYGNTATCSFEVKLIDNTGPVIANCPADIVVSATNSSCDVTVNWSPPVVTDNCAVTSFNSNHQSGDIFPIGITTVTYTAIDEGGNIANCSFDITVEDQEAPAINNCPADLSIASFDPGESLATVNWTEPLPTDNCAITSFTSSHQPGSKFAEGQTIVTYRAMDTAGNEYSCSFTVEVIGNSPPIANDIIVQTKGTEPVQVCFNASDKDGDGILLSNISYNISLGLVDQIDAVQQCFVYTPNLGSNGLVAITATICDDRNPSGCSEVKAEIEVLKEEITIYKAFSPNGDAINDVWHIGKIEQYPENTVTIFDRWGSVIYQVTGYNNENVVWDGRGNGRGVSSTSVVPSGTYFFSIELQGSGSKSGFLELIN
ncbi:MAG: HYR domain-containing protein [Bacteroidetes bacterium]|nr:MAG: HYR domain-containing protein [Bacteroidota bacterium]